MTEKADGPSSTDLPLPVHRASVRTTFTGPLCRIHRAQGPVYEARLPRHIHRVSAPAPDEDLLDVDELAVG